MDTERAAPRRAGRVGGHGRRYRAVDVPPDTAVDTAVDTGPEVCTPTTPEGVCNVIDQCGCMAGTWCVWRVMFDDEGNCWFHEHCRADPHGGLDVGQACDSLAEDHPCRPGTTCLDADLRRRTHYGTCREFCRTDGECSVPGSRCTIPSIITVDGCPYAVILPYNLCSAW